MTWPRRRMMYGSSCAVGVVGDAAAGVGGHLVLVDDPFQGGAVAQLVSKDFRGDAGQGEEFVVDEWRSCPG